MASVFPRKLKQREIWVAKLKRDTGAWFQYSTGIAVERRADGEINLTVKKRAQRAADRIQAQLDAGIDTTKAGKNVGGGNGNYNDLVKKYLDFKYRNWEPGTFDLHKRTLRLFAELTVVKNMQEISRECIEDFKKALYKRGVVSAGGKRLREITPESVNIHLRNLKAFMNCCVGEEWVKNFVPKKIKQEKIEEKEYADYYTAEECEKLLMAARGLQYYKGRGGRKKLVPEIDAFAPFLLLLLASGMRLGEALKLEWGMINFNTGAVRIPGRIAKGGLARKCLVPDFVLKILREAYASEKMLFEDWESSNVHTLYDEAIRLAGIKRLKLHNLRDTFVQNLENERVSLRSLKAQIGHRKGNTINEHYLYTGEDEIRMGFKPPERGAYFAVLERAMVYDLVVDCLTN